MRLPLRLLFGATAGLALLQARPVPGQPALLVFAPGTGAEAALLGVLAAPGWDPVSVRPVGPMALAVAAPATTGHPATPAALRRAAGALLALNPPWLARCGRPGATERSS
jgi:hypothetical protein